MQDSSAVPEEGTDVVEPRFQTPMLSSVVNGVAYLDGPYVVNRFMMRRTARSIFRITRSPLTGRKSYTQRKRKKEIE